MLLMRWGMILQKNAVATHCKYAKLFKGTESVPLTESPRGINIIPESDVYRLVMRSKLPSAERFQDWVCEDVLPSIRKTGQYSMALPDFSNPAIAARAWAEQYEARMNAETERDIAIRTKSQIGSRREAQAMNTASRLSKENIKLNAENGKLRDKIGIGKTYKAISAIKWLPIFFGNRMSAGGRNALGRFLTRLSKELNIPYIDIETSAHNKHGYHSDVIAECRSRLEKDKSLLAKYRIDNAPKIIPLYAPA